MRILWDNRVDKSAFGADSEAANFPVEHVQDTRLATPWRSKQRADCVRIGVPEPIFQGTTNLVTDPEDLSAAGWTKTDCTAELSDLYADGRRLTKITVSSTSPAVVYRDVEVTTATPAFQAIFRRGLSDTSGLRLQDRTAPATRGQIDITWATQSVTALYGATHLQYRWLDADTVWVSAVAVGVVPANDNEIIIYPDTTEAAGDYAYATAVQVEDLTYPTPFVAGSRAVVSPDYVFEMPEKFTIDMIVKPWFVYDIATYCKFVEWHIDTTHLLLIDYAPGSDFIRAGWTDGGSYRQLGSQVFDDGTTYTNINQRIRIIDSIDLTTGDTTGSRLIVEPLESGAIFEDTIWNGDIDVKTSAFSTLSVGHKSGSEEADSEYEYFRIYADTLVGTVADSADADALLAAKQLLFSLDYAPPIKASYVAVAGHNIADGATVKLQGSPHGQFDSPPLDETLTWDKDIILKAFTEATYPYWRLAVDDPANGDGYVQIGRVYLGTYLQMDPSSAVEFPLELARTDEQTFSISGQMYVDRGIRIRRLRYSFPSIRNAMKVKMEEFWEGVGRFAPFIFMNYDTDFSVVRPMYCAITEDLIFDHLGHHRWKFDLSLQEVF